MLSMLTAPALTLLLLAVVVGLGIAIVWALWEIERASKRWRGSDRFGLGGSCSAAFMKMENPNGRKRDFRATKKERARPSVR